MIRAGIRGSPGGADSAPLTFPRDTGFSFYGERIGERCYGRKALRSTLAGHRLSSPENPFCPAKVPRAFFPGEPSFQAKIRPFGCHDEGVPEDPHFLAFLRFSPGEPVFSRPPVSHKESSSGFPFVRHRVFPWRFVRRTLISGQDQRLLQANPRMVFWCHGFRMPAPPEKRRGRRGERVFAPLCVTPRISGDPDFLCDSLFHYFTLAFNYISMLSDRLRWRLPSRSRRTREGSARLRTGPSAPARRVGGSPRPRIGS